MTLCLLRSIFPEWPEFLSPSLEESKLHNLVPRAFSLAWGKRPWERGWKLQTTRLHLCNLFSHSNENVNGLVLEPISTSKNKLFTRQISCHHQFDTSADESSDAPQTNYKPGQRGSRAFWRLWTTFTTVNADAADETNIVTTKFVLGFCHGQFKFCLLVRIGPKTIRQKNKPTTSFKTDLYSTDHGSCFIFHVKSVPFPETRREEIQSTIRIYSCNFAVKNLTQPYLGFLNFLTVL